jgi:hypothetical protein
MNPNDKQESVNSAGLFVKYEPEVIDSINAYSSEFTPYAFITAKQYVVYSQKHNNRTLIKINLSVKWLKYNTNSPFKRNSTDKSEYYSINCENICTYFHNTSHKVFLLHYLLISLQNLFPTTVKPVYVHLWFLLKSGQLQQLSKQTFPISASIVAAYKPLPYITFDVKPFEALHYVSDPVPTGQTKYRI